MSILYGTKSYLQALSNEILSQGIEPYEISENLAMIHDERFYLVIQKEAEYILTDAEKERLKNLT